MAPGGLLLPVRPAIPEVPYAMFLMAFWKALAWLQALLLSAPLLCERGASLGPAVRKPLCLWAGVGAALGPGRLWAMDLSFFSWPPSDPAPCTPGRHLGLKRFPEYSRRDWRAVRKGVWLMPTSQHAADASGAVLVPAWERNSRPFTKVSVIQENNTSWGWVVVLETECLWPSISWNMYK